MMKGQYFIEILKEGEVTKSFLYDNMILSPGVKWYVKYGGSNGANTAGATPTYRLELGSSNTAVNVNQTQLISGNSSWSNESVTPIVSTTGSYPNNVEIKYSSTWTYATGQIVGTVRELGVKCLSSTLNAIKSYYPELNTITISDVPLFSRVVLPTELVLQADEQLRLTYSVTVTVSSLGSDSVLSINGTDYPCTIYRYSVASYTKPTLFPTVFSRPSSTIPRVTLLMAPFTRNIVGNISRLNYTPTITLIDDNTIEATLNISASTVINGSIYGFSLRGTGSDLFDNEAIVVNLNGGSFTKTNTEVLNLSLRWRVSES